MREKSNTARMSTKALTLSTSTIGRKVVMAASGALLFGFVIAHMLGNLQIFLGPEAINEYSHGLHNVPALLWGARAVLLLAVLAHIVTAVQLALHNKRARPIAYRMKKDAVTSYAARTMVWSGPLLLLYIVYHLAHLTFGYTDGIGYQHLPTDANGLPDVYHNVVNSFRVPWVTAVYVTAQLALTLHLYHGAWSMLQSLGLNHRRYNEALRSSLVAIAMAVTVGFVAVPLAVQFGFVK
ncbi:MAG: succinate dehydrogenase cytochrome b subunit [Myxococcales bacterium]|nr:succinate dehydrogenase cytochrome b subunit [Myxococcales bacterium]